MFLCVFFFFFFFFFVNVPGAPMRADVVLCGSMFGLQVRRHRWFELSWEVPMMTPSCDHSRPIVGVYGHPHGDAGAWRGMLPGSLESWSEALGIDWMTAPELADAIPPAYTQFVGETLMQHIKANTLDGPDHRGDDLCRCFHGEGA